MANRRSAATESQGVVIFGGKSLDLQRCAIDFQVISIKARISFWSLLTYETDHARYASKKNAALFAAVRCRANHRKAGSIRGEREWQRAASHGLCRQCGAGIALTRALRSSY